MKPTLLSLAATALMAVVPTSDTPRPVARPGLVFDEARGKVVLFGGSAGSMPTDQTWEWDGRKWAKRDTPRVTALHIVFHTIAPYAAERERFLEHCCGTGELLEAGVS